MIIVFSTAKTYKQLRLFPKNNFKRIQNLSDLRGYKIDGIIELDDLWWKNRDQVNARGISDAMLKERLK